MSDGCTTRLPQNRRAVSTPWRIFLLVASLPIAAIAQSVIEPSSTSPSLPATASISTTTQASVSTTNFLRSMTTSFISSTPSNTTTSRSTSAVSTDMPPELFPGAIDTDTREDRNDSIFNYYFLFLAVFGLLTAVLLWWIHQRRKRRKEQMRLSGHNALARDMDGWINTRRWFHGAFRHNQTAAFIRREEGLNERGEAPPPYQTKSDATVAHASEGTQDPVSGLAVPLRTLSRDEVGQGRPPEYRETISRGESSIIKPDTADPRTTRPETAITQTNSSTGGRVTNQSTWNN